MIQLSLIYDIEVALENHWDLRLQLDNSFPRINSPLFSFVLIAAGVFQVFTVRSNGAAGVVVKGPDSKTNITFR